MKRGAAILAVLSLGACAPAVQEFDVIVVGGGASGVCAGIQAARLGMNTLILEETPWLGGMLTSAGVSAIDGNYRLRAGIFGEFCDSLAARYGGYDALKTGWVSNILFEPKVGEEILSNMCGKEELLTVEKDSPFESVEKLEEGWKVTCGGTPRTCRILIDGTELGDVAKACGVGYDIGMESHGGIVQDMTYVATVKDFGPEADMTIPQPDGYDRDSYVNCCINPLNTPVFAKGQTLWSPEMMMSYGRLPGGGIMLNWPVEANDFYADIVDAPAQEREAVYRAAKNRTLGYIHFLQTELGMKNIGIADDEYPTEDGLPLFPYFRESRRIHGESLLTEEAIADPYGYVEPLYRAGIAVGDYPIDHHHFANPEWESLQDVKYGPVPSFTVPAGAIVPLDVEDLIVAEKSISVTNIAAGATRLQPVVMELGQAAGVLAALAVRSDCRVRDVRVRDLQYILLEQGARIQPYLDLQPGDPDFAALQKVGCTGIIRAEGRNVDWSNEMWMNVGEPLRWCDVHLKEYYGIDFIDSEEFITAFTMYTAIEQETGARLSRFYASEPDRIVTRLEAIKAIDTWLSPFEMTDVDWNGNVKR